MTTLHHYKVTTPSGATTILQLSEDTANRDYPNAVRVGSPKPAAAEDEGKKAAESPQNKAAGPPQNKSGD